MFQILKRIFSLNLEEHGENNVVNNRDFPNCDFRIVGNNNRIIISPAAKMEGQIVIYGNDNFIQIGEGSYLKGKIKIGCPNSIFGCTSEKCTVKIGKRVYAAEDTIMELEEDETKVSIGDDCAFARGTQIYASDMHSMTDDKGRLTNKASFVSIGNHVWFCTESMILRNSAVNDNSVVGARTIIDGVYHQTNVLIVGSPARIARQNINWSKIPPNVYGRQKE